MDPILYGIEKVNYLKRVVIALGGAPEEGQFQEAKKYFVRLRSSELDVKVVWVDGPRIQQILEQIQAREISTGVQGKGQSVWMALGYILAKEAVEADND